MSANLALGARDGATAEVTSIAQLASMLRASGARLGVRGKPGRQLQQLLAAGIRAARRHPRRVASFTPLFLAELARRRQPSLDLGRRRVDPVRIRWTALELELFIAWLGRGARPARPATAAQEPGSPCKAVRLTLDGLSHFDDVAKELTRDRWPDLFTRVVDCELVQRELARHVGELLACRAMRPIQAIPPPSRHVAAISAKSCGSPTRLPSR
jgi:hypothetical protein